MYSYHRGLSGLQKISMSLMGVLVLLTFLGANLQALFWQSSHWLVSTVLPAVVVELTNEERALNNEAPLVRNATLDKAAQLKAEDMAKHQYFSHYSPSGVSPWHWFDEAGYIYAHAGENLAVHFTDSTEVVEAWMNSPTHRENIVGPQYTEIGVGTAKGTYEGYDTVFVVQLFGAPAVAPAPKSVAVESVATPEVTEVAVEEIPSVAEEAVLAAEITPEAPVALPDEVEVVPVAASDSGSSNIATNYEPETQFTVETLSVSDEGSSEVVIIESTLMATSSGLAVAQVTTPNPSHAGATLPAIATQPNMLLQMAYLVIGVIVSLLLFASIVLEARKARMIQVAYGVLLLLGMGALWYTNALLTSGAVVV